MFHPSDAIVVSSGSRIASELLVFARGGQQKVCGRDGRFASTVRGGVGREFILDSSIHD